MNTDVRMMAVVATGLAIWAESSAAFPAAVDYAIGVADAQVPAPLAALIWVPLLLLTLGMGLALVWLLRKDSRRRRVGLSLIQRVGRPRGASATAVADTAATPTVRKAA